MASMVVDTQDGPPGLQKPNEDVPEEECLKPRPYQELMRDICVKQNTIIYLPTGAGKTFIALMVIKHFAKQLEKNLSEGGKRTIFLVNTVALARQQADALRGGQLPFSVSLYTGDMNVDNWKRDKWREEFEKNHIVVSTVQIILDVIGHGYLSISDINVLIFDECHNAVGDHPMHALMSRFQHVPPEQHPRVIGLTGILLKKAVQPYQVEAALTNLEAVFHGTIATVDNWEDFQYVMQFSTDPVESMVRYESFLPTPAVNKISKLVDEMIDVASKIQVTKFKSIKAKSLRADLPTKAKEISSLLKDYVYQMTDFGIYGASIAILAVIIELELAKHQLETMIERQMLEAMITKADLIRHILVGLMASECTEYGKLMVFGSHHLKCLVKLLEQYCEDQVARKELKALVFVQRRHSAKVLYHILKRVFNELYEMNPGEDREPLIRPDFMVGRAGELPESIEAILCDKNNRKVMEKFRKNETNLICASSVLEEGIDVQSCNLVIRYDKPTGFSSYVQTKGRARMKDSKYILMFSSDEASKEMIKIESYRNVEKKLKECLVGRTITRKPPLEAEIADELYNELIPPFTTPSGAILTALSALQLLNRYSNTMPHDRFTNTSVLWERFDFPNERGNEVQVKLYMPTQSTIKEPIVSNLWPTVKLAKRHAAFIACKQLYLNGELGENLLPIDNTKKMINLKETYFKHWENFEQDNTKAAGRRQFRRVYDIFCPEELTACTPAISATNYLYIIKVEPIFSAEVEEKGYDTRQAYRDMLESDNCLAILTTKKIPKLAEMMMFLSMGEIHVKLAEEPIQVSSLNEEQMTKLKFFHVMIFRDILKIKKTFFVLDHNRGPNSFFITPTKGGQIDWETVYRFQGLASDREPSIAARSKMVFNPENYLHKVIKPWYKLDQSIYVVTKVHTNLSPLSEFPEPNYPSYAKYFEDKYNIRIARPDQFMLEVKGISQDLKILCPGEGSYGANIKSLRYTKPEIYPPEFCHNFGFPGDLWLKAIILPCTLYRIQQQLIAHAVWQNLNAHLDLKLDPCESYAIIQDDKRLLRSLKRKRMDLDNSSSDEDDDIEMADLAQGQIPAITSPNSLENGANGAVKEVSNAVDSLCDKFMAPWLDADEPVDIDRNWDQIYPFELDYYVKFISSRFEDLALSEYVEKSGQIGNGTKYPVNFHSPEKRLAIKDVPEEEKFKLDLLSLTPDRAKAPQLRNVVKAFTAAGSNDVFDMERFEVLGDSLLKFSVSLYLINRHQDWHEGYLTQCKGCIVSNRNLFYCGALLDFPSKIRLFQFEPNNDWVPPLFTVPHKLREIMCEYKCSANVLYKLNVTPTEFLSGTVSPATENSFARDIMQHKNTDQNDKYMKYLVNQHYVGDKIVADSMEALLGVYLHAAGIRKAVDLLPYLKILPNDECLQNMFTMKLDNNKVKTNISMDEVDNLLLNYKFLETSLGYTFKDRKYLLQALTHPSFPTNNITGCYQQLEFIGDAILDFLITNYIFQRCPDMDPGQLTDLRSALTNNNTLACLSVRNNFHRFILSQNTMLHETISKFVDYQSLHKHVITDQVYLLRTENDRLIADTIDVPKVLGDIFESLIGAIFFDSGNDLEVTWKVIYNLMHAEILEFSQNVPKNLLRRLEEWPNAQPRFGNNKFVDQNVHISLTFNCKGETKRLEVDGFGKNTKDAKMAAAKAALQLLECAQAAVK